MENESKKITKAAILGCGSWGTALALVLADRGVAVTMYGNSKDIAQEINETRTNENYLPGAMLPKGIRATTHLSEVEDAPLILIVLPSKAVRGVLEKLAKHGVRKGAIFLSATKGIENDSGKRMSELVEEIFPGHPVAVLSGPTHAEEVAARLPTAAVIASQDEALAERLQDVFTLNWFRTYTVPDIIGVELGGTVKNVFAVAAGTSDGLGLGDNAKSAMVTRGLAEMVRLGVRMGGNPETFQGLSGVGDLMVTCYSNHSRNSRLGRLLGEGMPLEEAVESLKMVAEGVPNTESVYHLARKLNVRTPLIDQAYAVLYQGKPPRQALYELLSRDPRPEYDEETA